MRLAVLGDPVGHSLSPQLHRAAMAHFGLKGTYEARQVDAQGMGRAAALLRSGSLTGANITMPHKGLAARLADRLDSTAERLGSANTWIRVGGTVVGASTDGAGVRFAIGHAGLPAEGTVLVLGAGGAAAAALVALEHRPLTVSARRPEAAALLCSQLGLAADVVGWGHSIRGALVVNATPLGMQGASLPDAVMADAGALLDMVYGPESTPAVEQARQRRIPWSNGVPMLVGQARESFRLWTGRDVPPEVMLEAVNLSSSGA